MLAPPEVPSNAQQGKVKAAPWGGVIRKARPLPNLTPCPLNVVNVHCSVFKAQERGQRQYRVRVLWEFRPYEVRDIPDSLEWLGGALAGGRSIAVRTGAWRPSLALQNAHDHTCEG
jgi:hypothetical protein